MDAGSLFESSASTMSTNRVDVVRAWVKALEARDLNRLEQCSSPSFECRSTMATESLPTFVDRLQRAWADDRSLSYRGLEFNESGFDITVAFQLRGRLRPSPGSSRFVWTFSVDRGRVSRLVVS